MEFMSFLITCYQFDPDLQVDPENDNGKLFRKGCYLELEDWYACAMYGGIVNFLESHWEDFGLDINEKEHLSEIWWERLSVPGRELQLAITELSDTIALFDFGRDKEMTEEFYQFAKEQIDICNENIIKKIYGR